MKTSYFFYAIGFIAVLAPIVATEAFHNSFSSFQNDLMLTVGAAALAIGKIITIREKTQTKSSIFIDLVLVIGLLVIAVLIWFR